MGSDDLNLRVLAASSDDEKERNAARKVLKLLSKGRHWVLVVRVVTPYGASADVTRFYSSATL